MPTGPTIASKSLLQNLNSIKISKELLSKNIEKKNFDNKPKMKPQFDVRQRSLLGSSFNNSLNKISNEKEKEEFIKLGNQDDIPEVQTDEIKRAIEKINNRLSDDSITSNMVQSNPNIDHLYDNSIVSKLQFAKPQQKNNVSLAELFNQNIDEKVTIKPDDPLEYVRSVLGQTSPLSIYSNFSRYRPLTSVQDLMKERGKIIIILII